MNCFAIILSDLNYKFTWYAAAIFKLSLLQMVWRGAWGHPFYLGPPESLGFQDQPCESHYTKNYDHYDHLK